ncbi:MAG: hypothetical protein ACFFDN_45140 [Candidatus Hodarchaeota archaeon]
MHLLQSEEFFQLLSVYLYNTFYYPPGTFPLRSQTLFYLILLLLGLIPLTFPLLFYAFKLRGFVKYSNMWQPWKKLAIGWALMVLAGISGATEFGFIILLDILKQRFITWIGFGLILSPMVIIVLISISLTSKGIQQFYKSAKVALNPKHEIKKIRYIIAIHNIIGATIYDKKMGAWELDPDLIGGLLNAIQEFSSEIKKMRAPMRKLEYRDFEIIIEQGKYAIFALFIDGRESDWLRDKLNTFCNEFEKDFEKNLKNWTGEISTFEKSNVILERIFELYRI